MKKIILSAALLSVAIARSFAYTTVTVQDSISTDTHWTSDKQYLLSGYVYVTAGATLTIDPGVIIKGDKDSKGALIVERGAKLMAMGTASAPIVFTSNQDMGNRTYGDWGGVIICGKAPTNWNAEPQVEGGPRSKYGGTDAHDNSGEMHYVRIEFGGIAFSPNNEINGLTFCGVGDGTQIDHIQVSYSGDDSYEWFGGSVNTKYMVAYATWDDDFDTDNGYDGKNQFCVAVRDPYAADQSGSKSFESDSYQSGTATGLNGDTSQLTKPVFSNVTSIGPLVSPGSTAYDPQYVAGVHIRRGSAISILNSIIAGWPCGILIDQSSSSFGSTTANISNGIMQIRNTLIAGIPTTTPSHKEVMYVIDGARSLTPTNADADTTANTPFAPYAGPFDWIGQASFNNHIYPTEQTGIRLGNPFDLSNPGVVPTSTSPVVYNATHAFNPNQPLNSDTTGNYANYNMPTAAPDFTTNKSSDDFFTKVNYVGAFAGTGTTADNWMNGWCNFDPNNTDYTSVNTAVTNVNNNTFTKAVVYPNPTSGKATVAVNMVQEGNINIIASDITGKTVKNIFSGNAAGGSQQFSFDISDLKAGLYIISISANNKVQNLKLNVIK